MPRQSAGARLYKRANGIYQIRDTGCPSVQQARETAARLKSSSRSTLPKRTDLTEAQIHWIK